MTIIFLDKAVKLMKAYNQLNEATKKEFLRLISIKPQFDDDGRKIKQS